MTQLTLVIGNRNYSSWSLRAWLALAHTREQFEEIRLALDTDEFRQRIGDYSPARRVPVLHHGERVIWDTLAICEYLAEICPDAGLWPDDPAQRARARSISAEMHAGFAALRSALPMNCRARGRRVGISEPVAADIDRITTIWRECRQAVDADGGPWLFGRFTIADAMYAPVALRFATYDVARDESGRAYVATVQADPHVQRWVAAAADESETIAREEVGL